MGSGISEMKVWSYYGLEELPAHRVLRDYEKMIAALLADAVAVSAIELPAPYQAEDFGVDMITWNTAKVFLKDNPRVSALVSLDRPDFVGERRELLSGRMDGALIRNQLERIIVGLDEIINR